MAVFTTLGAALATTTFLSAVTQLVVGVALNAITQELFGDNDSAAPQRRGIVETMQLGAEVPRSFTMGRYATAGSLVYHNHWGHTTLNNGLNLVGFNPGDPPTAEVNNDYYTRVTALCDAPITGLYSLILDGKETFIDWANPDTELDRGYPLVQFTKDTEIQTPVYSNPGNQQDGSVIAGYSTTTWQLVRGWVKFYDGTQTTADPFLVEMVGTPERPWGTDCIGKGMAYAIVTLRYDEDLFKRLPDIKYVIDGIEVFDPRDSQTKPTRNPVLMMHQIINGITVEGQWLYGAQRPIAMNDAEIGQQATICSQSPPGWDALTDQEKIDIWGHSNAVGRYQAGVEVLVDEPIADALERLALSCNAVFADAGSYLRVLVGEPGASVATVTDDEFRSTREQGCDPFPPLAEAVNAIKATYPSPSDLWEIQDAPALYDSDFEAEDDNRRLVRSVDLVTVPWPEQVGRLMSAALTEARRARSNTGTLPSAYWALEPGDYITYSSARNGYVDKRFRVSGVVDLADGDVAVSLLEVDPTSYDWTPLTDHVPQTSAPPIDQPLPPIEITDFGLQPSYQVDAVGDARRPSILLQWTDPALPGVISGIQYQVRLQATGVIVGEGVVTDLQTQAQYIHGLLPNTVYEVRVRWQSTRPSNWSAWSSVTTPDVRLAAGDLADSVITTITGAQTDATQALANAATAQAAHDALVAGFDGTLIAFERRVSAQTGQALPDNFLSDGLHWTSLWDGDPLTMPDPNATYFSFADDAATSRIIKIAADNATALALQPKEVLPSIVGRTYRMTTIARLSAAALPAAPHLQHTFRAQTAAYGYAAYNSTNLNFSAVGEWQEFTTVFTVPDSGAWPLAPWLRFALVKPASLVLATGETIDVRAHRCEDITDAANISGVVNSILGLDLDNSTALGVMIEDLAVDANGNSAFVSNTATALATIEGNMASSWSLAIGAGGASAGLFLYASDDIDGSPETGLKIAADNMTIGAGTNLLHDSDFLNGLENWFSGGTGGSYSETSFAVRAPGITFSGADYPVLQLLQTGTATDGHTYIEPRPMIRGLGPMYGVPVEPGVFLMPSFQVSMHRCTGHAYLRFTDANGTTVTNGYQSIGPIAEGAGSSTNPNSWPLYHAALAIEAPAGSVYAELHVRKNGTLSSTTSYLMLHRPQICASHEGATQPPPYASGGVTLITGSEMVLPGTITANEMETGFITAGGGLIGDLAVDTAQIAGNAVSISAYTAGGASQTLTSLSTWVTVSSVTLNRAGYKTDVEFVFTVEGSPGVMMSRAEMRLVRGATVLATGAMFNSDSGGYTASHTEVYVDTDTGTGLVAFSVQMRKNYQFYAQQDPVVRPKMLTVRQQKKEL